MLLEVQNIETYYGSAQALKGVSLQVKMGELILLKDNSTGNTLILLQIQVYLADYIHGLHSYFIWVRLDQCLTGYL